MLNTFYYILAIVGVIFGGSLSGFLAFQYWKSQAVKQNEKIQNETITQYEKNNAALKEGQQILQNQFNDLNEKFEAYKKDTEAKILTVTTENKVLKDTLTTKPFDELKKMIIEEHTIYLEKLTELSQSIKVITNNISITTSEKQALT